MSYLFFFFNDTATTEIYTLSLHDALPIFASRRAAAVTEPSSAMAAKARRWRSSTLMPEKHNGSAVGISVRSAGGRGWGTDRKSTRLNSSHANISYAVFCLTKKTK